MPPLPFGTAWRNWNARDREALRCWLAAEPQATQLLAFGRRHVDLMEVAPDGSLVDAEVRVGWTLFFESRLHIVVDTFGSRTTETFIAHLLECAEPGDPHSISLFPGAEWTKFEEHAMVRHVNSPGELRVTLIGGVRHLGRGAAWHHAQDAWQDFCARNLRSAIRTYKPERLGGLEAVAAERGEHGFLRYVRSLFGRFCRRPDTRRRILGPSR